MHFIEEEFFWTTVDFEGLSIHALTLGISIGHSHSVGDFITHLREEERTQLWTTLRRPKSCNIWNLHVRVLNENNVLVNIGWWDGNYAIVYDEYWKAYTWEFKCLIMKSRAYNRQCQIFDTSWWVSLVLVLSGMCGACMVLPPNAKDRLKKLNKQLSEQASLPPPWALLTTYWRMILLIFKVKPHKLFMNMYIVGI